jgi:lysophospholipase L1-like esterase
LIKKRFSGLIFVLVLLMIFSNTVIVSAKSAFPEPVRYVALGDSIAYGLGVEEPTKEGYVYLYHDWLEEKFDKKIKLTNLGVPGWTSTDLLDKLKNNEEFRKAVRKADIITLDIGGNDLLHAINPFASLEENIIALSQAFVSFQTNYPAILAEIRVLNSKTQLMVMDYYIPRPYGQPLPLQFIPVIDAMNQVIAYPYFLSTYNVTGVAKVYAAFGMDSAPFLNISPDDGIHPNAAGHQIISDCFEAVTLTDRHNQEVNRFHEKMPMVTIYPVLQ